MATLPHQSASSEINVGASIQLKSFCPKFICTVTNSICACYWELRSNCGLGFVASLTVGPGGVVPWQLASDGFVIVYTDGLTGRAAMKFVKIEKEGGSLAVTSLACAV